VSAVGLLGDGWGVSGWTRVTWTHVCVTSCTSVEVMLGGSEVHGLSCRKHYGQNEQPAPTLPSQVKVSVHQLGQGSNIPLLQRRPAGTNTKDSSLLLGLQVIHRFDTTSVFDYLQHKVCSSTCAHPGCTSSVTANNTCLLVMHAPDCFAASYDHYRKRQAGIQPSSFPQLTIAACLSS
jgi:hypothetical protein